MKLMKLYMQLDWSVEGVLFHLEYLLRTHLHSKQQSSKTSRACELMHSHLASLLNLECEFDEVHGCYCLNI